MATTERKSVSEPEGKAAFKEPEPSRFVRARTDVGGVETGELDDEGVALVGDMLVDVLVMAAAKVRAFERKAELLQESAQRERKKAESAVLFLKTKLPDVDWDSIYRDALIMEYEKIIGAES